jgi:hypothetical protein
MDRIIFEGVRCFHERQSVLLKPLTLLVGENSTGKTTFLALTRMAWDVCRGGIPFDFNEEPFLLGSYDQISSYRGGRGGRVRSFTIGAQIAVSERLKVRFPVSPPDHIIVTGRFVREEEQPKLKQLLFDAGPFQLSVKYDENGKQPVINVTMPSGKAVRGVVPGIVGPVTFNAPPLFLFATGLRFMFDHTNEPVSVEGSISTADMALLTDLVGSSILTPEQRPFAFAPIRTRPQRTYDLLTDVPKPEGSHVPMILARVSSSDPKEWEHLRQSLDNFGKASGLFSDVEVRRMGQRESGPFQIKVKISGPPHNLVDVGYGVSQVLPIIVDCLRAPKGSTFLLQQPEVHLHPKAQAELGSFLGLLAKQQKKRFVIETHSDHLVDRIRMDVRDGKHLTPDDVALLYFERADGNVTIRTLELDRSGNILNAPRSYRRFFLEEEGRFLGGPA